MLPYTQLPVRFFGSTTAICTLAVLTLLFSPTSAQLCGGLPAPPTTTQEVLVADDAWDSVLGIEHCGRIMVLTHRFGEEGSDERTRVMIQRFLPDTTPDGVAQRLSAPHGDPLNCGPIHEAASIAVSALGRVRAGWRGHNPDCHPTVSYWLLQREFDFADTPVPIAVPDEAAGLQLHTPSVGISDAVLESDKLGGVAWSQTDGPTPGLLAETDARPEHAVRGCTPNCRETFWCPAVSLSPDGWMSIVWGEAETDFASTSFNIALRVYDPQGNVIAEYDGRFEPVNEPDKEALLSSQMEPAVAFDGRSLVVAWVGPRLDSCATTTYRIFARRLIYDSVAGIVRDPEPAAGEGIKGMFVVDTDPSPNHDVAPINADDANVAVALTISDVPGEQGAFVIAWNSLIEGDYGFNSEVRARLFAPDGMPRGADFRVNQATTPTGEPYQRIRQLANSAAHTVAYGRQGQVAVTWGAYGDFPDIVTPWEMIAGRALPPQRLAWLTLLPADLPARLCAQRDCLRGDCNRDGLIDGRDIQPFVTRLITGFSPQPPCYDIPDICEFDCNIDCRLTVADIPPFICKLLALGPSCTPPSPPPPPPIQDCNTNGIDDPIDIAQQTSADCNTNEFPDECEPDCNSNGYPDDCDVAEERSPDCNSNGYPDECDFDLVFLPSYDCNTNGVPDECDIASQYSTDENANNIPDECEQGGQQMMGGETINSQNVNNQNDSNQDGGMFENPAWAEFFEWQFENQPALRAMTRPERFEATRARLRALGLPDAIPWARVRDDGP